MVEIVPIKVGEIVKLKKAHACGTNAWRITKTGMDIGIECTGCGRRVRLMRSEFDRRFRGRLSQGENGGGDNST